MTVSDIITEVNAWLAIEDAPQPTLPEARVIAMVNAIRRKIARRRPRLECLEAVTTVTLADGQHAVALPSDFRLLMKAEVLDAASDVVCAPGQKDHELMLNEFPSADEDDDTQYLVSVWGGYLWTNWTADGAQTIRLWYYTKPTTFSVSTDTDDLLDEAFDCILDGVLARAVAFGFEEERSAFFQAQFSEQLQELHDSNQRRRTGDRPIVGSVPS